MKSKLLFHNEINKFHKTYFHNDNKTPVATISVGICTDDALISFVLENKQEATGTLTYIKRVA